MIKHYKILTIDGGGIKGLYSAVILQELEKEYGPIHQNFDLICGTSTGGIIALALAAGIPAAEVTKFYKEKGPAIFPYKSKWSRHLQWAKQLLFKSKYSNKTLKSALEEVFSDKRIEDCKTNVLIPTVNITTGAPYVFKSDHQPDLIRDSKRKLTEVALATTAAPTYFPIIELQTNGGTEQFVDGGLWSNNPSLLGIQEYLSYYHNKGFTSYCLLSVSSLHENIKFPDPKKVWKAKSIFKWGPQLISMMIDTQSLAVDNHIKFLQRYIPGNYIRIPSENLSQKEKKYIVLDNASTTSLDIIIDKAIQSSDKWIYTNKVKNIFKSEYEEETNYVKLS